MDLLSTRVQGGNPRTAWNWRGVAGSDESGARNFEVFETEVELGEKKMGSFLGTWQSVDSHSRSQQRLCFGPCDELRKSKTSATRFVILPL
jgi:hypothetical protein